MTAATLARRSPLEDLLVRAAENGQLDVACDEVTWGLVEWEPQHAAARFATHAPAAALAALELVQEPELEWAVSGLPADATALFDLICESGSWALLCALAARTDLPEPVRAKLKAALRGTTLPAGPTDTRAPGAWATLGGTGDPCDPTTVSTDELVSRLAYTVRFGIPAMNMAAGKAASLVVEAFPLDRVQEDERLGGLLQKACRQAKMAVISQKLLDFCNHRTPPAALEALLSGIAAKNLHLSSFRGDTRFTDVQERLLDQSLIPAALKIGGPLKIAALRTEGCPEEQLHAAVSSGDQPAVHAVLSNRSTPKELFRAALEGTADLPVYAIVPLLERAAAADALGLLARRQPLAWSCITDEQQDLAAELCADTDAVLHALENRFYGTDCTERWFSDDVGEELELVAAHRPDLLDAILATVRASDTLAPPLTAMMVRALDEVLAGNDRRTQVFFKLCEPNRPLLLAARLAVEVTS